MIPDSGLLFLVTLYILYASRKHSKQGRIQKFAKGGRCLTFLSSSFPSHLPFSLFSPLELVPLKPARGSGGAL